MFRSLKSRIEKEAGDFRKLAFGTPMVIYNKIAETQGFNPEQWFERKLKFTKLRTILFPTAFLLLIVSILTILLLGSSGTSVGMWGFVISAVVPAVVLIWSFVADATVTKIDSSLRSFKEELENLKAALGGTWDNPRVDAEKTLKGLALVVLVHELADFMSWVEEARTFFCDTKKMFIKYSVIPDGLGDRPYFDAARDRLPDFIAGMQRKLVEEKTKKK